MPDDEIAPWENFASDTEDPRAQTDTERSSRSTTRLAQEAKAEAQEKRRLRRVAIFIAVPFLAVVAYLLWQFVLFRPDSSTGSARGPITVARDGSKMFKTIALALRHAKSGEIIELHDELIEESITIDPSRSSAGVTMQAADGKNIFWGPSAKKDEKVPILQFSNARHFRFKGKGITLVGDLDGKRRVQDLVLITGKCEGLILEDLHFKDIGQSAVKIMNAEGTRDNPIRLQNLSTLGGASDKSGAAIIFDVNPDLVRVPRNDWIEVGDGNFEGFTPHTAIQVKEPANTVNSKNVILPKK